MIKINIEAENLNELKSVFAYLGQIAGTPLQQLPAETPSPAKLKKVKDEQPAQDAAPKTDTASDVPQTEAPAQEGNAEITHDSLRELIQGMTKENRKSAVAHLKKTYSIDGVGDIQESDLAEAYNAVKEFA